MQSKKDIEVTIDARMINASGIGRYLKSMLPFVVDKFNVTLLGKTEELRKFNWFNKVSVIKCNSPIYSIEEQIELPLKIPKCDLFWSPHYNIPIFPIKAKKRIVTIHDVYHLAFFSTLSILQKLYAKFMLGKSLRLSDVIITISQFSKIEIIKFLFSKRNIKVTYRDIDPVFYKYLSLNVKRETKEKYILYVGNVKPHKNLVRVLKAFSLIAYNDLKFKIVGQKDKFITADREIDKIARTIKNIEFTGYVSDEELIELYQKAKLFIFPSLYEGFGLPPLEAIACGTPVIVSNTASLPEIYGDAVYYVNPYNINDIAKGIMTVLNDKSLQKKLVHKGQQRVKRFTWEKSTKKLLKIIEEVINE